MGVVETPNFGMSAREFDMACTSFRFEITGPAKEVYMEMSGRTFGYEKLPNSVGAFVGKNTYGKTPGMMKSYVNGKPTMRMVIADGAEAKQYLLAKDLPQGKHTIFVSKCSETFFGVLKLHGLVVPEACDVKAPPAKKVIEILGDSNTTLPGGVGPNTSAANAKKIMEYTDTTTSWPAHLAAQFDADHYIVGCSGLGFMANAEKNMPHGPMIDIYGRILQNEEAEYSKMDDMNQVDLIVIFLGANDCIGGGVKGEAGVEGYKKLIDLVRSKRGPSVPILCVYPDAYSLPGFTNLSCWVRMMQKAFHVNIKKFSSGAVGSFDGKDNLIFAKLSTPTEAISAGGKADFGDAGHWNAEGGRKFSTGLIPLVRDITKWPDAAEQAPTQKVM